MEMSFYRVKSLWQTISINAIGANVLQFRTQATDVIYRHHHHRLNRIHPLISNVRNEHRDQVNLKTKRNEKSSMVNSFIIRCNSIQLRTYSSRSEVICNKVTRHEDWDLAMRKVENIVGSSTSFSGVHWLLGNDEVANVSTHFRKLTGSDDPLLKTAK